MLAKKSDNKLATTTITNQLIDEIGRIRGPIKSGEGRPTPAGRITLAKITAGVSGQVGRFNGRLQETDMKSDASGALVEADLGTFSSTDNCEIWDASELTPELVFLIGQRTTGKLVFLRFPRQIIWVKITGNETGGGKYQGKSYTPHATGDIPATGNLSESELGSLAGSVDCRVLNFAEEGESTHDLTAGTPEIDTFPCHHFYTNSDGIKVCAVVAYDRETCS